MKKRILICVLAMVLVFGMSACTKKGMVDETQMSTVETTDEMETTDTVEEAEIIEEDPAEETEAVKETEKKETPAVTSAADTEENVDSEDEKQETSRNNEPGPDEVGNFEGLETTDEINIDLEDGQEIIGG